MYLSLNADFPDLLELLSYLNPNWLPVVATNGEMEDKM